MLRLLQYVLCSVMTTVDSVITWLGVTVLEELQ